jgi:adenylyltransferase/sulfurtransferase
MDPDRYSRQILFAGIGAEGQRRLGAACVAIVGCGALGSFQAGALARAGVGQLLIVDRDYVEWSNLQRQWLFEESDARDALPKAIAAARRLAAINSGIQVQPLVADLTAANIHDARTTSKPATSSTTTPSATVSPGSTAPRWAVTASACPSCPAAPPA